MGVAELGSLHKIYVRVAWSGDWLSVGTRGAVCLCADLCGARRGPDGEEIRLKFNV